MAACMWPLTTLQLQAVGSFYFQASACPWSKGFAAAAAKLHSQLRHRPACGCSRSGPPQKPEAGTPQAATSEHPEELYPPVLTHSAHENYAASPFHPVHAWADWCAPIGGVPRSPCSGFVLAASGTRSQPRVACSCLLCEGAGGLTCSYGRTSSTCWSSLMSSSWPTARASCTRCASCTRACTEGAPHPVPVPLPLGGSKCSTFVLAAGSYRWRKTLQRGTRAGALDIFQQGYEPDECSAHRAHVICKDVA